MKAAIKHSRKRDAILAAIRSTKEHPGAEWLYAHLKSELPDISLGTVYRNLALFRENGEIVSVGTVNGQERFDANTAPHAHFVCTRCGSIIDLEIPAVGKEICSAVEDAIGAKVKSHSLTFFGLCDKCCENQALNSRSNK